MTGNRYHHEIDGLRAISVVVIILFHLKVSQFSGGFIGVDVFFVVSGFLISQIILGNLSGDSFTFRDFYLRRTTRILPALIVMVAAVLLVGGGIAPMRTFQLMTGLPLAVILLLICYAVVRSLRSISSTT